MFTQRLSMDCTKEQYEKYLKDELLKMGYDDSFANFWKDETVIVNNSNGRMGALGTYIGVRKEKHDRTYLGSFNASLFLALAAMTDNPDVLGYGEYATREKDKTLVRNEWSEYSFVLFGYHKSTKEEIMEKFKTGSKDIGLSIDITAITDGEVRYYGTIGALISILKSKGYKILKPKTWEEV